MPVISATAIPPCALCGTTISYIEKENSESLRLILPAMLKQLKKWDIRTNRGVDHFISISEYIRKRIKHAIISTRRSFTRPSKHKHLQISKNIEDYYLVVSRLNAYKRIDLVIEALTGCVCR